LRVNGDIARYESDIRKLPKEQQALLKIERRYNLSQGAYNLFLAKRSEADLVKAANVSDVMIIDPAKDVGGGQVGPNTKLNNIMAAMLGFVIPFLFVFLLVFFETNIKAINDIKRLSKVPILGVIGRSHIKGNRVVLDRSKSAVAEGFRAIRASLQFMYKKQGVNGTKTVLVTSSVSGEGKTFCSINIASVFALSQKKTVLVGLDLRKPKIFGDFDLDNDKGVVNYLIQDQDLKGIIQKTKLEYLDIITSGPIPPNPSELLVSDHIDLFFKELKEQYDYIILDSPPLGLVSDAMGLIKFADATLYMVRQNYTKKGMFSDINEKYKRGEITNLSFVLNFFEEKAKYGYGYGAYGNGYYENEKEPSLWGRIKKAFK
jgi:capsular exopolysaccharide synthesis family protein